MALSKQRVNSVMDKMHSSLLCASIHSSTKTADGLAASFTAAKLLGHNIQPEHEELIQNEILKRRRNEVPRDESMAGLASERVSATGSEGSERPEADRS